MESTEPPLPDIVRLSIVGYRIPGLNMFRTSFIVVVSLLTLLSRESSALIPSAPTSLTAIDNSWDDGGKIAVTIGLSPDDVVPAGEKDAKSPVEYYILEKCPESDGLYKEVARERADDHAHRHGVIETVVQQNLNGEPYWFRVTAVNAEGEKSLFAHTASTEPAVAKIQLVHKGRLGLLALTLLICGSVVAFILLARSGRELYIRRIAGLEAVEEAVGRATEMGKSCLFVPGILDMNEIQTIAGLTVLSHVAEQAAEYDAMIEVPTSKSLVMTAARETVEAAYLTAGRPDAFNEDTISYVTDEQFGYVAYLAGEMVRKKPAACFYMGAFFAESLILAETGNAIGAIQVAGTAEPSQLPFFVAACDYTLIGEEFFAASAYLSGDPDQLGSLKGQDVGKLIVGALLFVGVFLATAVELAPDNYFLADALRFLKESVLTGG